MTADNARSGVLIARLGRRVQKLTFGTVRALPELFGFTWIDWNFFFFLSLSTQPVIESWGAPGNKEDEVADSSNNPG